MPRQIELDKGIGTLGDFPPPFPDEIPVEYYLQAVAQCRLYDGDGYSYLRPFPTTAEIVLAPLLMSGEMSREELTAYLRRQYRDFPRFQEPSKLPSFVTQGLRALDRTCPNLITVTGPNQMRRSLSLDSEIFSSPSITPEGVQHIVRTAAMRWLLRCNQEERVRWIQDLKISCSLTEEETEMLDALLIRQGGTLYLDKKGDSQEKVRRVRIVQSLKRKLDAHFNQCAIEEELPYYGYHADPSLLKKMPGLSLKRLQLVHDVRFGPYLPVPQVLLQPQEITPPKLNAYLSAFRAAIAHWEIMTQYLPKDFLDSRNTLQALRDRVRRIEISIQKTYPRNPPSGSTASRSSFFPEIIYRRAPTPLPPLHARNITENRMTYPLPPTQSREPVPTAAQVAAIVAEQPAATGGPARPTRRFVRPNGLF